MARTIYGAGSAQARVYAADRAADSREKVESMRLAREVETIRLKAAADLLEGRVFRFDDTISELRQARAQRVTKMNDAIKAYLAARDNGTQAQRVRAVVDLHRAQLDSATKTVANVWQPNPALLDSYVSSIPEYKDRESWKNYDVAQLAWEKALQSAKTAEEWLAIKPVLEERHGKFAEVGFAENSPVYTRYQKLQETEKLQRENLARQEAAQGGFVGTFEEWAEARGFDTRNTAELDNAIARYISERGIDESKLPQAGSDYIKRLEMIAANPKKYEAGWASDIDGTIAEVQKERDALLAASKEEKRPEPEAPATLNEMLAAWVSRPDVRDWAEDHGFNLGTLVDPDPETQKLIDAGDYPKETLVKGKLYKSKPDDLAAMEFAYEQMGMDPQKSMEYALQKSGDKSNRQIVEVTVKDGERRAVRYAPFTDDEMVFEMDDGTFFRGKKGQKRSEMRQVGWPEVSDMGLTFEDISPEEQFGQPKNRTVRLYQIGRQYNTTDKVAVRGVDVDTGEVVELKKDEVVSKFYPGEKPKQRTDAERKLAETAKEKLKEAGYDDPQPIGDPIGEEENEARAARVREAATPEGKSRATRALEARADRRGVEVDRLQGLLDEAKREGNTQRAARLQTRLDAAKARAKDALDEARASDEGRRPGLPTISDEFLDENLNPRRSPDAFVEEYGGPRLTDGQDGKPVRGYATDKERQQWEAYLKDKNSASNRLGWEERFRKEQAEQAAEAAKNAKPPAPKINALTDPNLPEEVRARFGGEMRPEAGTLPGDLTYLRETPDRKVDAMDVGNADDDKSKPPAPPAPSASATATSGVTVPTVQRGAYRARVRPPPLGIGPEGGEVEAPY